jgi:hypothetical protein
MSCQDVLCELPATRTAVHEVKQGGNYVQVCNECLTEYGELMEMRLELEWLDPFSTYYNNLETGC